MGSGQLLTLRWLAQLPAEPSAGRKAANIWRTFLRERLQSGTPGREKCTCTHVGPRGRLFPRALGLVFLVLFRSPFSPGPQPHPPGPPGLPGSDLRSLLHWRPRLARGHPRSAGKRHHFSMPLEHLQASASHPTPILSMKNRGQDRRGAEPSSNPAPRPGVSPTEGGHGRPCPGPARSPAPAQCPARPGGRPGRGAWEGAETRRGEDGLTAGEREKELG